MDRGASGALGERSVSVAGDVVGSLIVTGDNNNVNLVLGAQEGAMLEQLARSRRPMKRLRATPVRAVPPPFGDSLDRDVEVRTILDAVRSRTPINVLGPRGIGKTYAVLRALNADEPGLAESVVYLYAPGPLDDVLQLMFEAWYECDPPFKPSDPQLRRDLAEIDGLVALDSVDLERDAAQQVLLAATGCRVVVASRERVLTEGTSIAIRGLATEYAVVLVERELGRPLERSEREAAGQICSALEGHPLKIREAVASARDADRSLADLATELSGDEPEAALSAEKLRTAGEDGRRLLAALALFGDATVGREHLRAISDADNFDEALMAALRRRDIRAHSPRYDLGVTLAGGMQDVELTSIGERALAHFTAWADENRARPSTLMTEASALVALLRWAVSMGRWREAIRLGRAVDHAFALERRFGTWQQVLDLVHAAAVSSGDRESEAWSLHQLGTRAVCLGDLKAGSAILGRAIELRRELGDADGTQVSTRNLAVATRSKWLWRWIARHGVLLGIALAVITGGAVAAAELGGSGQPSRSLASPGTKASNQSGFGPPARENKAGTTPGGAPVGTKTLAISVSGSGSVAVNPGHGNCSESCRVEVKTGSNVSLVPTPADGFLLASWSGACSGSSTPCPVSMKTDQSVTANFNPAVTLTVRPRGLNVTSDKGSIHCGESCSATFPAQTTVTLTASTTAFWFGAPGCAQRASVGSTRTQDGTAKQAAAAISPSQGDGGLSTTTTEPTVPRSAPPATQTTNTSTTVPAGSSTCQISLDKSYTVGAYPAPG